MSGAWNPGDHPRDGDTGRFVENWTARLADQLTAARRRGAISSAYLPTERGSAAAPHAKNLGYVRVGEHPTRMGAVGGEESYFGSSTHPDAGGVWVDPARPGTSRAPVFRNDFGSPISTLRPAKTRSQERQEAMKASRREPRESEADGGKIGRRLEGAPEGAVKEMRRAQARARVEGSARASVRRTPRGTRVDDWMSKINDRIGQKGTGRG